MSRYADNIFFYNIHLLYKYLHIMFATHHIILSIHCPAAIYYTLFYSLSSVTKTKGSLKNSTRLQLNVRPEIRKELFHFEITTLTRVKEFILKGELLNEKLNKFKFTKLNVHNAFEIENDALDDGMVDMLEEWLGFRKLASR